MHRPIVEALQQRAKPFLALALLALPYSVLRLKMNHEYTGATWDQLLSFSAPLPFGHRVLASVIARALMAVTRLPAKHVFTLVEFGSTVGLVVSLREIFRLGMPARPAAALSASFLFLLPFLFLLQTAWPVFYPYDTLSLFLTALGFWALLTERRRAAVAVMFLAALNRETALLLVPLLLALRLGRRPTGKVLVHAGALLASFLVARTGIRLILTHNPGRPLHWMLGEEPRVLSNLAWLAIPSNTITLLAYLGFLPLAMWLLRAETPALFKRVPLVLLPFFLSLCLVGNVYEPRIFGELLTVGFVPVAFALHSWLTGEAAFGTASDLHLGRVLRLADRWGMPAMLAAWVLVVAALAGRVVAP